MNEYEFRVAQRDRVGNTRLVNAQLPVSNMAEYFHAEKMGILIIRHIAPFTLRTLLYGDDHLDLTENKRIITETLRFINDSKRLV